MSVDTVKLDEKINTACILFEDGNILYGQGFGSEGSVIGELCFNTSMTGYQEVMTDPSYAEQIVTFTFPHIGNTGINTEDDENKLISALAMIVKWDPTKASNWRSQKQLSQWLKEQNKLGIGQIDTRYITRLIREKGAQNIAVCCNNNGNFNIQELKDNLANYSGLIGKDLAKEVSCKKPYRWNKPRWTFDKSNPHTIAKPAMNVVAIDYGAKTNILRCLMSSGCEVTVMPAQTTAQEIIDKKPDGLFLSNGPGDPEATGNYAVPMIQEILDQTKIPIFGICLGHQMLALALGAKTLKMKYGHHGANHPVKDLETGKVEITSMNHGFTVDSKSLPEGVIETHLSLFDGTNCGIRLRDKPVFSVQYHPEASPGPQDSFYLFEKFVKSMSIIKQN